MKTMVLTVMAATAAVVLAAAATGNRQVTQNKLSPTAETSMTLGSHHVTIEYNAPSARGRKVEGGLIPYGQPWRLGADAATTLTTDADIMIGKLRVPKGVHTLYLLANENGPWELIVNKQTRQWGTEYNQGQDLGRVPMTETKLSQPVEKLNIVLKPTGGSEGVLEIQWGTTQAGAPVKIG